jgi:hypothetical protein
MAQHFGGALPLQFGPFRLTMRAHDDEWIACDIDVRDTHGRGNCTAKIIGSTTAYLAVHCPDL